MNSNSAYASALALIDTDALDERLAAEGNPVALYKQALASGAEALAARFEEVEDGRAVVELVRGRAHLIDSLLRRIWGTYFPDEVQIALVAVGGYGRGELHPASDIDLLILLTDSAREQNQDALERFLTFLWDIGLEVGQSVRTLEECVSEADADITVATNLLEARLLTGPIDLFTAMREATGPDRLWTGDRFFRGKQQEQAERYRRFGDTAYHLEPHVKEGPGALRDVQVVFWVAKHHFGTDDVSALVECGFLTDQEFNTLMLGQAFLWRVRGALHLLTGRREDRLLFDYQRELAQQFGYTDTAKRQGVELFMQHYYRTVMELERINEMLLQFFHDAIFADSESDHGANRQLNKRFHVTNGYLAASFDGVFKRYPFALLEVFLLMQQHPELNGVHAETIRAIRSSLYLIDDDFRCDIRCTSLFQEIMRQPAGITHELRRMNRYGVLAAYLPVFGQIVGLMQHDLFHIYTVDEHTLMVVRNLRRFSVPEYAGEFPSCSHISQRLPKPELLYMAGLFHDIAKGRGGNHAELGALEVKAFCTQHRLNDYDGNLISWLVASHLVMSSTAQKQDLSDPDVIHRFAELVGDQTHLDYLYLLTVGDICGTDPKLWNAWKDTLLSDLHTKTSRALARGLTNRVNAEQHVKELQIAARTLLESAGISASDIDSVWSEPDSDYFLSHTAEQIAWHTQVISKVSIDQLPLIVSRRIDATDDSEIFVFDYDRDGLFAISAIVLDYLNQNILQARLFSTRSGYSMGSYRVSGEIRNDLEKELNLTLKPRLLDPDSPLELQSRALSRTLKQFSTPTSVSYQLDEKNHRTILELVTTERRALLAMVSKIFLTRYVRLQKLSVVTVGTKAEDVFFVTDFADQPLDQPAQDSLREALIKTLDKQP